MIPSKGIIKLEALLRNFCFAEPLLIRFAHQKRLASRRHLPPPARYSIRCQHSLKIALIWEACAGDALRCLKMHFARFANGEPIIDFPGGREECFLVKCPCTPKSHTTDFRPMFDRKCKLCFTIIYNWINFAMAMQHFTFVLLPTVFRLKNVSQLQ